MTDGRLKVAVIQTAPARSDSDGNRARALERVVEATENGARLIVLPECAISGYAIDDSGEATRLAEPLDGPSVEAIWRHCAGTGAHVAFGLLERSGETLFNSAVLVGPEGVVGCHRKAHVVPVAVDAHVAKGDAIEVFKVLGVRLGMMICYEVRFPELARVMALKGAQIILVVANWPAGARVNPDIMSPARAAENNVHLLAANRTGSEGSLSFLGNSAIHLPTGECVVRAGTGEETLYAEITPGSGLGCLDVSESRYTVDLRGHRRPDLYTLLTERTDSP